MNTMRHTSRNPAAFTIVELLVVMSIIVMLGIMGAVIVGNIRDHIMGKRTEATIRLLEIALNYYKNDVGHYPLGTSTDMVRVLTETSSGWKRAGLGDWFPNREKTLKDAWDQDFYYCSAAQYDTILAGYASGRGVERTPGKKDFYNTQTFQIYSMGANMRTWPASPAEGGHPRLCGTEEDDIRNWKQETFYQTRPFPYN